MPLSTLTLILATVAMSAVAQLLLKLGVTRVSDGAVETGFAAFLKGAAFSPFIWFALAIYGASVIAWLWVLSKVDLSVAYPFVGISFVLTMAFGLFLLQENVSAMRIVGTLLVVGGCILVARSA